MHLKHYTWLINRVLETRFPGERHVKKIPHQTWSDHENQVLETRFIAQNRVFETQDVSKIYTFKTVPTNYIVRKMGLILNFGLGNWKWWYFFNYKLRREILHPQHFYNKLQVISCFRFKFEHNTKITFFPLQLRNDMFTTFLQHFYNKS